MMVELLRLHTLEEERGIVYSAVVDVFMKMNNIEPLLRTAFSVEINSCPKGAPLFCFFCCLALTHNLLTRLKCSSVP